MIERTNRTIEECLSKYIGKYQHEWTEILAFAMMAYQTSILSVSKYIRAYVLLGFPLSLPIDCIYNNHRLQYMQLQRTMFSQWRETTGNASNDARIYEYRTDHERPKTYYDRSRYGPSYKSGEVVLVFNPRVKKGETRNFTLLYRGPYKIVEIINDLNFKVEDKKTRKVLSSMTDWKKI